MASKKKDAGWKRVADERRQAVAQEQTELGPLTGHADVYPGKEKFEQELELKEVRHEKIELEVKVPFLVSVNAKLHATPVSPVPLVIAGCLCALVLLAAGAPLWALLAVVGLSWLMAAWAIWLNRKR